MNEKIYRGAVVIFEKEIEHEARYLVIQNTISGTITFPSWAEELSDASLEAVAHREISEEIGEWYRYILKQTWIKYRFIFWRHKPERMWSPGEYEIFKADGDQMPEVIPPTKDTKNAKWLTREKVLEVLSFDDLKEVFKQAIWAK